MKIMLVSDSLRAPTSFAVQSRLLVDGFLERGHEVVSVGATHMPLDDQPQGLKEYTVQGYKLDEVRRVAERERPDVAIMFNHLGALNLLSYVEGIAANIPVFYWMPWEGSSLPPNVGELWHECPQDSIVHLTEYAKGMWKDHVRSDIVIPHGVDLDIFNNNEVDKVKLRRKWSKRFGFPILRDGLVLVNVDRNDIRKRWDLTFDLCKRLQQKLGHAIDIQLIAHTYPKDRQPSIGGFDLEKLIDLYDLRGSIILTGYDQPNEGLTREELAELYQLSDYYVSTTTGEGFGIPALESMACGTPAVVPAHTALSEVLEGYDGLIDPSGTQYAMGSLWTLPDVEHTAKVITHWQSMSRRDRESLVKQGIDIVASKYDAKIVVQMWEELLARHVTEDYHGWYLNRWGHSNQARIHQVMYALAMAVKGFNEKTLEIGSFTGAFLNYATSEGVGVTGLEPDLRAINLCSPQADAATKHLPYAATWPDATLVVLTDVLDLINASGDEGTESLNVFFERLSRKRWVIARWGTTHRWDLPEVSYDLARDVMENQLGFQRRFDLESIIMKKYEMFDHEIWMNPTISSDYIPQGIEAMK